MNPFIHKNFLFDNQTAVRLYEQYAENLPIIDYHCHLSPEWIAEDRTFKNLTEIWLEGDHYKWRAMRANGIPEAYCTGNASPLQKFEKWAETVPAAAGNPLYHWTHLELARYFNIFELLFPATAMAIYEKASSLLQSGNFSTRSLIKKMNVQLICTTDDPVDDLSHHQKIALSFDVKVLPAFRPDAVLQAENPEKLEAYLQKLEISSGIEIRNFENLTEALDMRHGYFHDHGCRLSDHGLSNVCYAAFASSEISKSLGKIRKGRSLSPDETEKYKTAVLAALCKINHKRGWVQQFHVGAIRNNSNRLYKHLGPDTGFDSIGQSQNISKLAGFLSHLDETDELAKTLLYNLNPSDNEMFITMAGNFNDGSTAAKVQYGAAWWFLDQKPGIEKHLKDISSLSLLSRFVGMVTDSRSLLSYPRHEYFRRLLCNFIGNEIEKGLIPDHEDIIKPLIEGVSYRNARDYFGFEGNA